MHRCSVNGVVVRDPELRVIPSGKNVLDITIGSYVPEGKPKEGEEQEWEREYFRITYWEDQAEEMAKRNYQKGDHVVFSGRYKLRRYVAKNKEGQEEQRVDHELRGSNLDFFFRTPKLDGERATQGDFRAAPDPKNLVPPVPPELPGDEDPFPPEKPRERKVAAPF